MSGEVSLQGEAPVYIFLWGKECNPVMGQETCHIRSSGGHIHLKVEPVIFGAATSDDSCPSSA